MRDLISKHFSDALDELVAGNEDLASRLVRALQELSHLTSVDAVEEQVTPKAQPYVQRALNAVGTDPRQLEPLEQKRLAQAIGNAYIQHVRPNP